MSWGQGHRTGVVIHLSMSNFCSSCRNCFYLWVWVLRLGVRMESGGQSGSKMRLWYRKIESQCFEVWYTMCDRLSGRDMCLGKLCLPAASTSAAMVGSTARILHEACFTVVPNLQSDLHQNSCRGWVKIAWAYFCIYIYNSKLVFFLTWGKGKQPNAAEISMCPEPQPISPSLSLVSEDWMTVSDLSMVYLEYVVILWAELHR